MGAIVKDNLDRALRDHLARDIRRARKMDRLQAQDTYYAHRRNRSMESYAVYLRGFEATCVYVAALTSRRIVDLGSGTGRALSDMHEQYACLGLEFVGTGLIGESLVFAPYRVTPCELMRGFAPATVGGCLSVFGAPHYSRHMDLVLKRVDEMLVSGGVAKFALAASNSGSGKHRDALNAEYAQTNARIREFFDKRGYGIASVDVRLTFDEAWRGLAFLAVKPTAQMDVSALATSLMEADAKLFDRE